MEAGMEADSLKSIDPRELGVRLQQCRRARGLTQEQVADRLAIARTTLTAIEKGDRRLQPDELIRLATLYGTSVNELLRRRTPEASFSVQLKATFGAEL